jgi:hypothetical protein
MYFQAQDLGCEPLDAPFLSYQDGRLMELNHFALSPVSWWILKNHGIAVFGPPPETLQFSVDMHQLLRSSRKI